jgi:polyisoprenoid-binding protein YceI
MRSLIQTTLATVLTTASLAVGLLAATPAAATEVEWNLDKAHSSVGFSVRHLGVSKVKGEFSDYSATVKGDETGKLTVVEATIKTTSVDTGIKKRDDHLRSDDFFNAEKFPDLKVKLKKAEYKGGEVTVTADITIRDKTKTITLTGEFNPAKKLDIGYGPQFHTGYSLKGKLNRQDFGLKFNAIAEGTSVVADDVDLLIEAEFQRPAK